MLTALDEKLCGKCPHLVVVGVACDWRPSDECPYLQNKQSSRQTMYRPWIPVAKDNETDAIRSID